MITEWLTQFFKGAVSTEAALPISIATLILICIPDSWALRLGIEFLFTEYGLLIGAAFIFSTAALISRALLPILKLLSREIKGWVREKQLAPNLKDLTPSEKELLRPFIEANQSSIYEDYTDGTIHLLSGKKIVRRASSVAVHGKTFSWILQPWARRALNKKPHLIDL